MATTGTPEPSTLNQAAGAEPFRPFTPGSGEAVVRITSRFEGCGSFVTIGADERRAAAVRHRTLWATRTDSVDLPTTIRIPAPEVCPER